jgi:hypothetical protein
MAPTTASGTMSILVFVVAAFVVGQILDAVRDTLWERVFDRFRPLNWKFFFKGKGEDIDKLEAWFFTYYVLDINLFLGLLIVIIEIFLTRTPCQVRVVAVIAAVVFLVNGLTLRKEIAELIPGE